MTYKIDFDMSPIVHVIVGYLLGTYFTPYMFLDLRLTQWYNAFTWCWIFLWPIALVFHFFIWLLASGALLGLICAVVLVGFFVYLITPAFFR